MPGQGRLQLRKGHILFLPSISQTQEERALLGSGAAFLRGLERCPDSVFPAGKCPAGGSSGAGGAATARRALPPAAATRLPRSAASCPGHAGGLIALWLKPPDSLAMTKSGKL